MSSKLGKNDALSYGALAVQKANSNQAYNFSNRAQLISQAKNIGAKSGKQSLAYQPLFGANKSSKQSSQTRLGKSQRNSYQTQGSSYHQAFSSSVESSGAKKLIRQKQNGNLAAKQLNYANLVSQNFQMVQYGEAEELSEQWSPDLEAYTQQMILENSESQQLLNNENADDSEQQNNDPLLKQQVLQELQFTNQPNNLYGLCEDIAYGQATEITPQNRDQNAQDYWTDELDDDDTHCYQRLSCANDSYDRQQNDLLARLRDMKGFNSQLQSKSNQEKEGKDTYQQNNQQQPTMVTQFKLNYSEQSNKQEIQSPELEREEADSDLNQECCLGDELKSKEQIVNQKRRTSAPQLKIEIEQNNFDSKSLDRRLKLEEEIIKLAQEQENNNNYEMQNRDINEKITRQMQNSTRQESNDYDKAHGIYNYFDWHKIQSERQKLFNHGSLGNPSHPSVCVDLSSQLAKKKTHYRSQKGSYQSQMRHQVSKDQSCVVSQKRSQKRKSRSKQNLSHEFNRVGGKIQSSEYASCLQSSSKIQKSATNTQSFYTAQSQQNRQQSQSSAQKQQNYSQNNMNSNQDEIDNSVKQYHKNQIHHQEVKVIDELTSIDSTEKTQRQMVKPHLVVVAQQSQQAKRKDGLMYDDRAGCKDVKNNKSGQEEVNGRGSHRRNRSQRNSKSSAENNSRVSSLNTKQIIVKPVQQENNAAVLQPRQRVKNGATAGVGSGQSSRQNLGFAVPPLNDSFGGAKMSQEEAKISQTMMNQFSFGHLNGFLESSGIKNRISEKKEQIIGNQNYLSQNNDNQQENNGQPPLCHQFEAQQDDEGYKNNSKLYEQQFNQSSENDDSLAALVPDINLNLPKNQLQNDQYPLMMNIGHQNYQMQEITEKSESIGQVNQRFSQSSTLDIMLDKNELYKSLFKRVRERLQQEVEEQQGMIKNQHSQIPQLDNQNCLDGIQLNENLRQFGAKSTNRSRQNFNFSSFEGQKNQTQKFTTIDLNFKQFGTSEASLNPSNPIGGQTDELRSNTIQPSTTKSQGKKNRSTSRRGTVQKHQRARQVQVISTGHALTQSHLDIAERSKLWLQRKQNKVVQERNRKELVEISQCTFTPQICAQNQQPQIGTTTTSNNAGTKPRSASNRRQGGTGFIQNSSRLQNHNTVTATPIQQQTTFVNNQNVSQDSGLFVNKYTTETGESNQKSEINAFYQTQNFGAANDQLLPENQLINSIERKDQTTFGNLRQDLDKFNMTQPIGNKNLKKQRQAQRSAESIQKHIRRQATKYVKDIEQEIKDSCKPGSGNLWRPKLTQPRSPRLQSHQRGQIKNYQKQRQAFLQGAMSTKSQANGTRGHLLRNSTITLTANSQSPYRVHQKQSRSKSPQQMQMMTTLNSSSLYKKQQNRIERSNHMKTLERQANDYQNADMSVLCSSSITNIQAKGSFQYANQEGSSSNRPRSRGRQQLSTERSFYEQENPQNNATMNVAETLSLLSTQKHLNISQMLKATQRSSCTEGGVADEIDDMQPSVSNLNFNTQNDPKQYQSSVRKTFFIKPKQSSQKMDQDLANEKNSSAQTHQNRPHKTSSQYAKDLLQNNQEDDYSSTKDQIQYTNNIHGFQRLQQQKSSTQGTLPLQTDSSKRALKSNSGNLLQNYINRNSSIKTMESQLNGVDFANNSTTEAKAGQIDNGPSGFKLGGNITDYAHENNLNIQEDIDYEVATNSVVHDVHHRGKSRYRSKLSQEDNCASYQNGQSEMNHELGVCEDYRRTASEGAVEPNYTNQSALDFYPLSRTEIGQIDSTPEAGGCLLIQQPSVDDNQSSIFDQLNQEQTRILKEKKDQISCGKENPTRAGERLLRDTSAGAIQTGGYTLESDLNKTEQQLCGSESLMRNLEPFQQQTSGTIKNKIFEERESQESVSMATQSQIKIRETFDIAHKTSAFQPIQVSQTQIILDEKDDQKDEDMVGTDALTTQQTSMVVEQGRLSDPPSKIERSLPHLPNASSEDDEETAQIKDFLHLQISSL